MVEYCKSLFPFRWIIVLLFIVLTALIISMGHMAPVGEDDIHYFKYIQLWHLGNIMFWVTVDKWFGLGRKGDLFKKTK